MIALEQALSLTDALDLPGEQWPILAALAKAYQARGLADRASAAHARSLAIVQQLATTLGDVDARMAFLVAAAKASACAQ